MTTPAAAISPGLARKNSVFCVINPEAGRGRGTARIETFLRLLKEEIPHFEHGMTQAPGDERALTEKALADGFETIVAMGGDGTWSAVANCLLHSERRDVRLALLPTGTGNDFGKTFGISYDRAPEIVCAVREGHTRTIDVGRVGDRYFLNVVGIGFDLAVIEDAAKFRWLKGDALYQFCALRQLFQFPGIPLTIREDAGPAWDARFLMVIVANARYFGGSFLIAPDADVGDGKLDLVAIRDAAPWRRAALFQKVGRGKHAGEPEVHIKKSARLALNAPKDAAYEVDGDVFVATAPLEITSVPGALNLVVPPMPPPQGSRT